MVDKEEKTPINREEGGIFTKPWNIFVTAANSIFGRPVFHYQKRGKQPFHSTIQLQKREPTDLIALLGRKISYLRQIERYWKNIGKTRKKIENIYLKLGPYTTMDSAKNEWFLMKYGAPHNESENVGVNIDEKAEEAEQTQTPDWQRFSEYFNKITNEESMKINGIDLKFRVPQEWKIKYPDGQVQGIRTFGRENAENYRKYYTNVIDEFCKKLEAELLEKKENRKYEKNIKGNIGKIKRIFEAVTMHVTSENKKIEAKHYGYLKTWVNDKEKHQSDYSLAYYIKQLDALMIELKNNTPARLAGSTKEGGGSIRYQHTYRVIRRLTDAEKNTLRSIIPPLKGEADVGLDENGRELEVNDNGEILLDIFHNKDIEINKVGIKRNVRKLPKQFHDRIVDLDPLDVANYIHNEWDSYRDDFRDGRYHPHSLTILDYTMAMTKGTKGKKEWKLERQSLLGKSFRKYKMRLGNGNVIEDTRKASNLNPAFDKRALRPEFGYGNKWEHIGRKHYYDIVNDVPKNNMKDPLITSRGLSLYVIQKVMAQMKYFNVIHENLKSIGSKVGFDYGPRTFGDENFCTDPFNIDLSRINQPAKSYKDAEAAGQIE